jgi:PAS domain S-box-containing protein
MNIRILVIDDDEDILFIAQQLLTAQDPEFQLVQVSTPQGALRSLDEEAFDAVICDFYLGSNEMNGLQILEWLRDKGCNTPFIIFTGRSREEVAIQALNLGADYYLEKGDDLEGLFTEIGHHIRNVVKNRKTEEALYESEQRYRTLVKSVNDQIYVLDEQDHLTQFHSPDSNPHLPHPQEILGKSAHDVFPSGFLEHFHTLSSEVRATGVRKSFDFQLGLEETEKWLTVDLDLHEDQKSIIVIIRDISERKKAENEVKLAEREWRNTFDSLPDLVAVLDNNFRIIKANKSMADALGCSREELIGRECYEVMHNSSGPFPGCPHLVTMESGEKATAEILDPNLGKPFLVTTSPIFEDDGNPAGVVHIAHDISEGAKAEDTIRAERDRAQSYLDIAEVILIALDLNGNVTLINRKGCEVLECSKEEALGQNWFDTFLPERIQNKARNFFSNIIEGHLTKAKYAESLVITKSGKERTIYWVNGVLRNDQGKIMGTLSSGEDISERIRLSEELQASEEFLNSIIEASPIAVNAYDSEGVFIRANKACLDLFGLTSSRALEGHNIFSDPNLSEDDKQKMLAGEVLRFEGSFNFDLFRERTGIETIKSGEEYIESVIAPLGKDDSGNPKGFIIQILEISERMEAERKLQESEARFRAMFEHAAVGVARVDVSGRILEANRALESMLGYDSGELKGTNAIDITIPEHQEIEDRFKRELIEGERNSYNVTKCYICKDGRKIWGRLTVSLVRNYNGVPEFTIGILEDFTRQKQAEESLAESEAKFRSIFERAGIGMTLVDVDDYIIEANSAFQKMLGYDIDELRQMKIADFTHPDDALLDALLFKEILEKKRDAYQMTKRYITKEGKTIVVNLTVTVARDENEEISFIIGMAEDISGQIKAEEDLNASEIRFKQVIDSSPMGIQIYELDSENNLILTEANQAADRILGVDHNTLIGKGIQRTFSALIEEEVPSELWDIAEIGSVWKGERISYKNEQISQALEIYAFQSSPGKIILAFLDSIDRKIAEQTLKTSEESLRTLFDTVEDMLFIVGLDERVITTNKSARINLGYTEEELRGMPAVQLHPVERQDEAAAILEEMIDGKTTYCPVPLITKNGIELQVETQITLGKWQGSDALFGISRDISQRMNAEKALEKQVEFLNEVIESLDHPFYVIDVDDYSIQMANRAARNGVEQLHGTCHSITHLNSKPCSGEDHPCPLSEVKKTKCGVVTEHTHYDSEGNARDVEVHAHPVLNDNNEVTQMIEYSIDITERKKAIRALEASEQRFRTLFEKAPLGYQTLDMEARIINVNQEWLDTTGYAKEDVVGHHLGDFMTVKSQERFLEIFPILKEEGFVRDEEFELVKSNRRMLVIKFNARASYDESGEFKQAHCIFQDVTDWKRADDLLRRQKEELSELAHIMSHDLGNKMKNIRSLVKIAKKKPEEVIFERIDSIAHQSADLLQASADLADAGIVIDKMEKVDLNAVVKEMAKTTIPDSILFRVDELPTVFGSPEKLGQIFHNLFVNAVEHGKPRVIEVRKVEHSSGTSIIVKNDGTPIPADIKPQIFRRGFTTKERGTGLGLSIAKKLIEAHGWRISLEPGNTTSFKITLNSI